MFRRCRNRKVRFSADETGRPSYLLESSSRKTRSLAQEIEAALEGSAEAGIKRSRPDIRLDYGIDLEIHFFD